MSSKTRKVNRRRLNVLGSKYFVNDHLIAVLGNTLRKLRAKFNPRPEQEAENFSVTTG